MCAPPSLPSEEVYDCLDDKPVSNEELDKLVFRFTKFLPSHLATPTFSESTEDKALYLASDILQFLVDKGVSKNFELAKKLFEKMEENNKIKALRCEKVDMGNFYYFIPKPDDRRDFDDEGLVMILYSFL